MGDGYLRFAEKGRLARWWIALRRPIRRVGCNGLRPGLLVRIDETAERTVGRFVNRRFQAVQSK